MKSKIILHIDDDSDDRELLRDFFKNSESTVIFQEAVNGKEAMDLLTKAKAIDSLPSLILLDIKLPDINGTELLKKIKTDSKLSSIPILFFTSHQKQFLEGENIKIYSKPSTVEELKDCIKVFLSIAHQHNVTS